MIEMRRRWRTVFLSSLLGFVLLRPAAVPAAPQEDEQAEIERYMASEYTWCDTALLSSLWGESTWEAKLRIGRKIGWGDYDVIEQSLGEARQRAAEIPEECGYYDNGYTFEDVELLADFWGVSIADAKAGISQSLFGGDAKALDSKLADLRPAPAAAGDEEAAAVFWDKGYTFCDARLVAETWDTDVWEAKVSMGNKVLSLGVESADEALGAFREDRPEGFTCNYADEGYTYDDIVALANFWDESVDETKTVVEDKIYWGYNDELRAMLDRVTAQ